MTRTIDRDVLALTCCPLCGLTRCAHIRNPNRPAPVRPFHHPGPPPRPVTARGFARVPTRPPGRRAVPSPDRVSYRAGVVPMAHSPARTCRPGVGRHRRPTVWGH